MSDPFARYVEPETEQAAFDILSACGLDVQILPILGAGASFLSKGFIDQARAHAQRVLDLLRQMDPNSEIPVVGIEPPEIYALKHDYIDLLPQRQKEIIPRVNQVWLLDEFLVRSEEFNNMRIANMVRLASRENGLPLKRVNFHPHCHQRAQGPSPDGLPNGTSATVELLQSCGYEVEIMDTGCCGMAGTFGYEAEHYELSMKVGELKLFPALRELALSVPKGSSPKSDDEAARTKQNQIGSRGGGEGVISSGAACRMQIKQGTGVEAMHPVLLVAQQVREWKSHGK